MRLYYVKTMFQLLGALLDKKDADPNGKAVFLMNTFVKERILDFDIFNSYFNCDFIIYNTDLITNKETQDEKIWLKDIKIYYDNLLKENNYSILNFDSIHVYASIRFSLYLCQKNISFSLHEDGNGAASKTGFVQWRENVDCVDKRKIAEKFGLLDGSCKFVSKLYCRVKSQTKQMPEKVEDFDVGAILKNISQNDIEKFLGLFTKQKLTYDNTCLILTQYYFKNKQIEYSDNLRAKLYLNIANYFSSNYKVLLKPHPADKVNYLDYYEIDIIDKFMPSELLLCYEGLKINRCITVSSTSIQIMKDKADEIVMIGDDVDWILNYSDLLQGAVSLYKAKFNKYQFMHYGIYNADINKILSLNNLKNSNWFSDARVPRFIVIGEKIWGNNANGINLTLRKNDIVVILKEDKWREEIQSIEKYYELIVKNGEFYSKAIIICGIDEHNKLINGFKAVLNQNVGTLNIVVKPNDKLRLNILENEIVMLKEELELVKNLIVRKM